MAKIVVRIPEPKPQYDQSTQQQMNRALQSVVDQLNSTFLQDLNEKADRFAWFKGGGGNGDIPGDDDDDNGFVKVKEITMAEKLEKVEVIGIRIIREGEKGTTAIHPDMLKTIFRYFSKVDSSPASETRQSSWRTSYCARMSM